MCSLVTGVQTCALPISNLPTMPQAGLIFQPPHWRGRMSASWEEANFVLSASGSFVGGTKDNRFQPSARVQSFVTFDTVATFRSARASGLLSDRKSVV